MHAFKFRSTGRWKFYRYWMQFKSYNNLIKAKSTQPSSSREISLIHFNTRSLPKNLNKIEQYEYQ